MTNVARFQRARLKKLLHGMLDEWLEAAFIYAEGGQSQRATEVLGQCEKTLLETMSRVPLYARWIVEMEKQEDDGND